MMELIVLENLDEVISQEEIDKEDHLFERVKVQMIDRHENIWGKKRIPMERTPHGNQMSFSLY